MTSLILATISLVKLYTCYLNCNKVLCNAYIRSLLSMILFWTNWIGVHLFIFYLTFVTTFFLCIDIFDKRHRKASKNSIDIGICHRLYKYSFWSHFLTIKTIASIAAAITYQFQKLVINKKNNFLILAVLITTRPNNILYISTNYKIKHCNSLQL